ncbi:winged helix-turn-helix domain-containing protein [Brenneria tiliae]|uniref:winged helix-turn-helix domain-containing protein n=1 Tax=Brenneria tiliae TaxID=2914984 RepID=UPI002014A761|nr:winged helix-turn-helix domain-containing protein [Brenneria tiliae]MCL2900330.1 winged helix-turn-helix domain-containing protein [Brenneria tiliae]MCL2904183.1 winged helix-turn-helix domain-containing protein [Brenneria tiliae]
MLEKLTEALAEGIDAQQAYAVAMPVQISVQMSVENSGDLSPSAQRILAAIAATPTITIIQLADKLGMNRRTVERNIKILREKGRLIRVGATKSGSWRVV